jgi:hypothetical protein
LLPTPGVMEFVGHASRGLGIVGGPAARVSGQGGLFVGTGLQSADARFPSPIILGRVGW